MRVTGDPILRDRLLGQEIGRADEIPLVYHRKGWIQVGISPAGKPIAGVVATDFAAALAFENFIPGFLGHAGPEKQLDLHRFGSVNGTKTA